MLRLQEGYLNSYNKRILGSFSNLYQEIMDRTGQKFEQLKIFHESLKKRLESCCKRLENKKNRQGDFKEHERPKNYSFSVLLIRWVLLYIVSGVSIRTIATIIKINSIFFDLPTPCYTIIGEWSKKVGFYIYTQPKDKNVERIWIVDFSIQFGQDKLMLVLGVDINKIKFLKQNKKKLKLGYQDVEILHKAVLKSTAHKNVLKELEEIAEKCGLPLFVLSDEGSDLAKGVRIFIENHPGIKHLHDISHKLSNILKAELEKNPKWQKFCNAVTYIKQKLKLSNIAELCPPKFRHKARFLNVRDPLKWAFAMLNLDKDCLDTEQKTNFITYIEKPLEVFRNEIIRWNEYSNFIESVETEIKHNGLTRGDKKKKIESTHEILLHLLKNKIKRTDLKLYNKIIKFVEEEEAKLSLGQTVICSSDIVESMFGKWKSVCHEDSMAGITDMILILPLLTVKLTDKLILKALEETSIQKINEWKEKHIGKTMYTKRRKILGGKKSTVKMNDSKVATIKVKNSRKKDRKSGDFSRRNNEKIACGF
jgi:hypothetical protein